jgi:hypothetical protein
MKHLAILAFLCIIFTTFSCTPEARLERREDKLEGVWEFDKAFYRSDWDLFRDDVMGDFRGDLIEFYDDYSAVYEDASENTFFDGEWEMFFECEWDYVDDEEEVAFYLDMYFFDVDNRESFAYFTSVNLITKNKLHLKAHTRDGVYTFKLRKI